MRRAQFDKGNQPIRNIATNPNMITTNGGLVSIRQNLISQPNFEYSTGSSSVVRTNLCTNPGMEVSGSGVGIRTNLCTNPGLETAASTLTMRSNSANNPSLAVNSNEWFTYGGGSTSPNLVTSRVAASWSISGWAWKVEGTPTATTVMEEIGFGGTHTVAAGVPIAASIYVIASGTRKVRLRFRSNNGTDTFGPVFTLNPNTPTRVSHVFTQITGATTVGVSLHGDSASSFTTGDWIAASMALIEVNRSVINPYFDGSNPAAFRTNLSTNPQATASGGGWTTMGSASGTSTYGSSEQSHTGTTSVKRALTGTGNSGIKAMTQVSFATGDTVSWSVWVRPSRSMAFRAYWERSSPYTGGSGGTDVTCPANVWTKLTGTITFTAAQSAGDTFGFGVLTSDGQAGDVYYVDTALIEASPVLGEYFDGSTTATPGYTFAWSGTANSSTSVARDPDFTYSWSGTANASQSLERAATTSFVYQNASGNSGVASRMYQTLNGRSGKGGKIYKQGGHVYAEVNLSGLTPSTTYTISCDVLSSHTSVVNVDRGATANASYFPLTKTVTPGLWTRISRTFTTGESETTRVVSIVGWENASAPDGSTAIIDNILIEQSAVALPYFDGSTASANGLTYAWSGTAHASTSNQNGVLAAGRSGLSPNSVSWQSSERSFTGTNSAAVLTKKSATNNVTLFYPSVDYGIGSGAGQVPANTTITWSCYVWVPSGGGSVMLMESITGTMGAPNTLYDQWERISVTVTTWASGGINLRLRSSGTVPEGVIFWVDGELLETSNGVLPYFDAATPIQNLVANPSFATNTSGWTPIGATLTRVTNQGGDGHCCEISQTIADANRQSAVYLMGSSTPAGTYTVSFDMKGTDPAFTNVRVLLYDPATTLVRASANTPLIKDGNFNRYTFNLVADGPWDRAYMEVQGVGISIGAKAWIDRAMIEKTTSPTPYYYEGLGDFTYSWTGTANASTSEQKALWPEGWSGATNAKISRTAYNKTSGTYGVAVITKGSSGDGIYYQDVNASAGISYTLSAWVKTSSTHRVDLVLRFKDAAQTILSDSTSEVSSNITVGQWTRVSITAVSPANTSKIQAMFRIYVAHTPTTFFLDCAMLEATPVLGTYFDGSTPAAGDFSYVWSGTADRSVSNQAAYQVSGVITTKSTSGAAADSKFYSCQSTAEDGAKIARFVAPAGTPNSTWRIAGIATGGWDYTKVKAGGVYTLMFRWRSMGWAAASSVQVQISTGGSQSHVMMSSPSITMNQTGWQEYRKTFTALRDADPSQWLYISLPVTPSATTDGIFDIRDWMLVEGEYTGDYIDGSKALSKWEGPPNASISVGYPPQLLDIAGKPMASSGVEGQTLYPISGGPYDACTVYLVYEVFDPTAEWTSILSVGGWYSGGSAADYVTKGAFTYGRRNGGNLYTSHTRFGTTANGNQSALGSAIPGLVQGFVPRSRHVVAISIDAVSDSTNTRISHTLNGGTKAQFIMQSGNGIAREFVKMRSGVSNTDGTASTAAKGLYFAYFAGEHSDDTKLAMSRYLGNKYGANVA
ncbi:minor tail protein [Arthrobacter phage Racecar]|nr:minor tail protein [Arthrobacter phage Racecar]